MLRKLMRKTLPILLSVSMVLPELIGGTSLTVRAEEPAAEEAIYAEALSEEELAADAMIAEEPAEEDGSGTATEAAEEEPALDDAQAGDALAEDAQADPASEEEATPEADAAPAKEAEEDAADVNNNTSDSEAAEEDAAAPVEEDAQAGDAAAETPADEVPAEEAPVEEPTEEAPAADTTEALEDGEEEALLEPEPVATEPEEALGEGEEEETGDENTEGEEEPAEDENPLPEGVVAMELDTDYDVIINDGGLVRWFAFTPDASGLYRFASSGDYDTFAGVYTDMNGEPLEENDDKISSSSSESDRANFQLDYALDAGTTYYYAARMLYEDTTGSFTVKLSWVSKAIRNVTILHEPRTEYYYGYDTSSTIDYRGLLIEVEYTDGVTERVGGLYSYSSVLNSSLNYSVSGHSTEYVNNRNVLSKGTFSIRFYLSANYHTLWEKTYEAEVVEKDITELTLDTEATMTRNGGMYYRFTAPEAGTYLFRSESSSNQYEMRLYAYDSNFNSISSIVSNDWTDAEDHYHSLVAATLNADDVVYLLMSSYSSGYSGAPADYVLPTYTISVAQPSVLTEEITSSPEASWMFAEFTPTESTAYRIELGNKLSSSSGTMRFYNPDGDYDSYSLTSFSTAETVWDGYSRAYYFETPTLTAGETYLISWQVSSGNLAIRLAGTIEGTEIEPGQSIDGLINEGKTANYVYQVAQDGYYHIGLISSRYMDSNVHVSGGTHGNTYYSEWWEDTGEDKSLYHQDRVFWLEEGEVLIIRAEGDYDDTDYTVSLDLVPDITGFEITQLPDKTEYINEKLDYDTGLQCKVTYADGVEETISQATGSRSPRTGLGLRYSNTISSMHDRYITGTYPITVRYMDQSASFDVSIKTTINLSSYNSISLGVKAEGTAEVKTSYSTNESYGRIFTPQETGCYQVTGFFGRANNTSILVFREDGSLVPYFSYTSNNQQYIDCYLEAGKTYLLEFYSYIYYRSYSYTRDSEGYYVVQVPYEMTISNSASPILADGETVEGTLQSGTYHNYYYVAQEDGTVTFTYQTEAQISSGCYWNVYNMSENQYVNNSAGNTTIGSNYYYTATTEVSNGDVYLIQFYPYSGNVSYVAGPRMVSTQEEAETLEVGNTYTVSIDYTGQKNWFEFTPEETGRYQIYSFYESGESSYDTYVELYLDGTEIAYNDDGGNGYQFSLTYKLEAGKTYRYACRMLSTNVVGDFKIAFNRLTDVKSIEITALPKTEYIYPFNSSVSYYGLQVQAVLEDETIETVSYGNSASEWTGDTLRCSIDEAAYDTNGYLLPGEYPVTVTYGGLTATYTVTVSNAEDLSQVLLLGTQAEGTTPANNDIIYRFTPQTTGYYKLQAELGGTSYYPNVTVYVGANRNTINSMLSDSLNYYDEENVQWLGYTYFYYMETGSDYYIRLQNSSSITAGYHLIMTQAETASVDAPYYGNTAGYYAYLSLTVPSDGYYVSTVKYTDESSMYRNPTISYYRIKNGSSSEVSIYRKSGYSGNYSKGTGVTYLEAGTYLVRLNHNKNITGTPFEFMVSQAQSLTLPGEYSSSFLRENNLYDVAAYRFTVPKDGTYTIRTLKDNSYYTYMYLYDDTMYRMNSISNGGTKDDTLGKYVTSVGGTFEAGREYILILQSDSAYDYTVSCEDSLQVESIEWVTYPRQKYYYKLDGITKTTTIGNNASIKVTYNEGDEETLSYGYTSSRTGISFTFELPEDAKFNASGQLMPGTYQAKLTYMNKTVELPIQMVTVSQMPQVVLDEQGQGSYSGETEWRQNNYEYGYIRFRATEDGFYNLTLSTAPDTSVSYRYVYNSAYRQISLDNTSSGRASGGYGRYLSSGTVYVRKGQTCYVYYQKYNTDISDQTITLSVARATDRKVVPLTLNEWETVEIADTSIYQWYSYTPETSGYYYMNIRNAQNYTNLYLYESPDSSSTITSASYYNNYDRILGYNLTAGKTYYYRINSGYTGTFDAVIVKQATAVSLELLTEGDIYCSTIPDYVENSFVNLRFLVTYEDGTTEEMTYGTNGTTTKYISLQGQTLSFLSPNWRKDADGNIVEDIEYSAKFRYGSNSTATCTVTVIPRAITGLDNAEGTFNTGAIESGKAKYYQFTASEDGYYRFEANASYGTPQITLYDEYMTDLTDDFSNNYTDGNYHQVKVYRLTEGKVYCLRIGNNSSSNMNAGVTVELIPPATSLEITEYPQLNYYLGVDNQYSETGLKVTVTYEDGTTEVIEGGSRSEKTGLRLETYLNSSDVNNHYLGNTTGTRTVYVRYMDADVTSYTINVLDQSSIPELTEKVEYTESLASAQDAIYLKFVPADTGFYRIALAASEGTSGSGSGDSGESGSVVLNSAGSAESSSSSSEAAGSGSTVSDSESGCYAQIDAVLNSTSSTMATRNGGAVANGDEKVVYMLSGMTYYLRGSLWDASGSKTAGAYTAYVQAVDELSDSAVTGTTTYEDVQLYQMRPTETGYYQLTIDAAELPNVTMYSSALTGVYLTKGQKNSTERAYYAAKLTEGAVYLVEVRGVSYSDVSYMLYAGKRPDVTSITVETLPNKTLYYSQFETTLDNEGLVVAIHYEDDTEELLTYGERSKWGFGLNLDYSSIERDESGHFAAGTQTVGISYLGLKTTYDIEVKAFTVDDAKDLAAETMVDMAAENGASDFWKFTPEADSEFRFHTRNASAPVTVTIYDADFNVLKSNTGTLNAPDAEITLDLAKDQTYIIRVRAAAAKGSFTTTGKIHDNALYIEVTGVSIEEAGVPFNEAGQTLQLHAVVEPADAANQNVTWSSSDTAIATVDATGLVTAVGKSGTATITVTTEDGAYTASVEAIYDTELPVISGVSPAADSTLGPAYYTVYIYAHDNTGVETVTVEYKRSQDSTWQKLVLSDKDEDDNHDSVIIAPLNKVLAPCQDGDILNLRLTAKDKGGNYGVPYVVNYKVDKKAPEVSDLTGVWNTETISVDLAWKGMMEQDIDTYSIYRKLQDAEDETYLFMGAVTGYYDLEDYTFTDDSVPNTEANYTYRIIASDKYGNYTTEDYAIVNVETWRVNQAPVIKINASSLAITNEEWKLNLNGSTDDRSIASMTVDYGDGTNETLYDSFNTTHVYTLDDETVDTEYTVTITATDDEGLVSVETWTVRVVNADKAGFLRIRVVDEDGIPVPGAPVYFNMGEDTEEVIETDGTGWAEFIGSGIPKTDAAEKNEDEKIEEVGLHDIGVYMPGYLPVRKSYIIYNGRAQEYTMTIQKGELVKGELTAKKMNLDEIRDAGIDLDDPDNSYVVQYNVKLIYDVTFNTVNGNVVGVSSSSPDCYYEVRKVDDLVLILEIPMAFSMLKEFFDVNLYIYNMASEEFSLVDNHVHLNLPDSGLTLVDPGSPQDVYIDEIKGQDSAYVQWYVRGDEIGTYPISADYEGILDGFNKPVTATFVADKEIEVKGVSNLKLKMQIPDRFTNGEFYYNLIMENIGDPEDPDDTVYLPGINGEGELVQSMYTNTEGVRSYVTDLPEALKGSEKIERFYRITDQIIEQMGMYGDYDKFVFTFRDAMIWEITSYGIELEIEVLPGEDLMALYDQYRALPATDLAAVQNIDAVYGYEDGDVTLTASATPAENAEYNLTYTWYDTNYKVLGTGAVFELPTGLAVNGSSAPYHYHVMVTAQRKDNGHQAKTDYLDVPVTVLPRTVELAWAGDTDLVYDGEAKNVTATVANAVGSDVVTVTVTGGDAVDAGTWTAEATALSDTVNYVLPDPATHEYVIQAKEAELDWSNAALNRNGLEDSRVYDGLPSMVEASVGNLVGDDECDVTVTGGDAVDAGSYVATATVLSNANYSLPAETTHAYEIEQRTAELVWSGNDNLVYDGAAKNVTAAVGNAAEGDEVTVTVEGGAQIHANTTAAATYTATATALSSANYKLGDEVSVEYTIAPKEVTLTWNGTEDLVYDGAAKNVTATAGGLVEGDTANVTVTGGTSKDAGTYTATAAAIDNTDYVLPTAKTTTYTIAPKPIGLTWSGNADLVYDGTAKNVTAVGDGVVTDDTVAVTVTGGTETNAGTYTAAASITNTNYVLTETETTYTIAPKPVSLTWSGYDDLVYDGAAKNVTAAVTGAVAGETVAVTVTGGDEVHAGTYTATAAISDANYTLTGETTKEYTIAQREISLLWPVDETFLYNGTAKNVTATANGVVSGDTVNVTVTGGDAKDAGEHAAVATALDNADYKLPMTTTFVYEIAPKTAELSWSGLDVTYDGAEHQAAITVTNLETGDTCDVTVTGGMGTHAGSYAAQATALGNANYVLPAETEATLTIAQRELQLTWQNTETRGYDGTPSNVTAIAANAADGDTVNITVTGGNEVIPGTYTATATAIDNTDYVLPASATTTYEIVDVVDTTKTEWTWTEDEDGNWTAAAQFTYTYDPTHTETVDAVMSDKDVVAATYEADGSKTVVATATIDGASYTDEKPDVVIPMLIHDDGWFKDDDGTYYYYKDNVAQTGWVKSGKNYYYMDPTTGAMQTGWKKLDGKWYYLKASGAMATGWNQIDGDWYYMNTSGQMLTKWQQIGGKWYWFKPGGQMVTGWRKINSNWYYFNTSGVMQTGWQQIGSTWYYFKSSGAMVTGWQQISNKWYWFTDSGAMKTGWKKINEKWYYFGTSGVMQTGWQQIKNDWYYFNTNGAMATGWKEINGKWYWFDEEGIMFANGTKTINGKSYTFNKSGVWVS